MQVLLPNAVSITYTLLGLLTVILALIVLISEYRASKSWGAALSWTALACCLPILGFVLWAIWHFSIRPSKRDSSELLSDSDRSF